MGRASRFKWFSRIMRFINADEREKIRLKKLFGHKAKFWR